LRKYVSFIYIARSHVANLQDIWLTSVSW